MILELKRTPGIYLVGFMGSGKSTVGKMLAEKIGWRFVDTDEDIEAEQKTSISSLFSKLGEEQFRLIETEAIQKRVRKIQAGNPMVVALGGGAFTRPANVELLSNNGISIWLDVAFPVVRKRVDQGTHRPLARDPKKFEELFQQRREYYAKANYRIEILEDNSRAALAAILELPLFD
ncbi:MAG TPA: shikimate kinase [Bryobacteraceae bacterium]|nr:shikimate kinase [Bryobacteraceae bacterium]